MNDFICIAGNLGSGKTTLVRALSAELGWQVRPTVGHDITYLEDLFRDPRRWSFEAQMAFLSHKARSIKESVLMGIDFLVDRSIYEDIEIFARIFADAGMMDSRAYETYESYAKFILKEMPIPRAIMYCRCPPEVCEKRLAERPRPYQNLYPKGHIERLHKKFEEWISHFDLCPLIALDTHTYQTNNPEIIRQIVEDLSILLSNRASKGITQPELFPTPLRNIRDDRQVRLLQVLNHVDSEHTSKLRIHHTRTTISLPSHRPSVYIAAPFSSVAIGTPSTNKPLSHSQEGRLVDIPNQHGVIPVGNYRSTLIEITKSFERLGYQAILPHRDVNHWGEKTLSPKEVGHECIRLVRECDLFLGILGTSYGAHVEAGIAMALSKPTILVAVESEQETFMGRALRESGLSVGVKVKEFKEVISLIDTPSFQNILNDALALVKKRD